VVSPVLRLRLTLLACALLSGGCGMSTALTSTARPASSSGKMRTMAAIARV
jgi:hypothetical protein